MIQRDPVTILLVDDQPAKLLSYETILAGLGERLIAAQSGRRALEALLGNEVAVILVDVCMPDLDGFELAEMIRDHPRFRDTAIIFVSAVQLSDSDRIRGYRLGAVDYVPVPVIPEVLQAKVRVFAELYRKTRQLAELNRELEKRVVERTAELSAVATRLHLAMDVARLGTWDWNLDTGEVVWSEGHYALHGYRAGDVEPSYEAWIRRVHKDDLIAVERAVQDALATGAPYRQVYRALTPDGGINWCDARATFERDGAGRPRRMIGVVMDVSEHKAAEERQKLMLTELHHRVKNSLATVQAVAGLSARQATSMEAFCTSFTRRLVAMSRTHTLLVSSNWQRIGLRQLLANEVVSFEGHQSRVTLSGPPITLPSEIALTLGLAIHELTTNAAKHGALSVPEGRLEVNWAIRQSDADGELRIAWRELDGPEVTKPTRQGFGSVLLQRVFSAIPGGEVDVRFDHAGLQVDLVIPQAEDMLREADAAAAPTPKVEAALA
jgi:PAS domain S-box-containing protein